MRSAQALDTYKNSGRQRHNEIKRQDVYMTQDQQYLVVSATEDEDAWFTAALYLYPLNAGLYSQLLHRSSGVADVIGTVSLRRHPGQINTVMKNNKENLEQL